MRQQHIGPCSVRLDHSRIAKAVDDHAGQFIRFGMHQAIIRRIKQPFAQGMRLIQTGRKPCPIRHIPRFTVQNATDDFRIRVHRNQRDFLALVILKNGNRAGRQFAGTPVQNHFVGIDPRKATADRAGIGLGLKADNGKI